MVLNPNKTRAQHMLDMIPSYSNNRDAQCDQIVIRDYYAKQRLPYVMLPWVYGVQVYM